MTLPLMFLAGLAIGLLIGSVMGALVMALCMQIDLDEEDPQ